MSAIAPRRLQTRRLLGPQALIYFYRRRLRAHGTQELLAGVGIAVAVGLVLAATVAQSSIVGSTRKVLHAVTGPANVALRARGAEGFPETILAQVEQIPGVAQAAPLLERTVHVLGRDGHSTNVYVAGTDVSLAVLNGLGKTLPLEALRPGVIGLSRQSASALGVGAAGQQVTLLIGGVKHTMRVSALLGSGEAGALSGALVGVMPLASMQQLLGQPRRVTRILVHARAGQTGRVAAALRSIAGQRLIAGGADEDLALLEQALRPSGQANALFAIIGALLGFLLAFNAILLTVPERRQVIADLRLSGTPRSAIVQLVLFQALCLGVAASAVGLAGGYALSRWVFHQSTAYLAEAFAISGGTVVPVSSVLIAAAGGILITCLASAVPLADLRRKLPRDAIYMGEGVPGNALAGGAQRLLFAVSLALLAGASALYAAAPSQALIASVMLALATVLAVPIVFAWVLRLAQAVSERAPSAAALALALSGLQRTTLRSLALAATGAVALFGSVALGGARANLLAGIGGFSHAYAADAPIWVSEPGDNQAVQQLSFDGGAARIGRLGDVASVKQFQGSFLTVGHRRVWVIARPPGGARRVLATQTLGGAAAASRAQARLAQGGWVAVSQQIAEEHHVKVGGTLRIAMPSGIHVYRVAALTSNLAWSPGVLFMSTGDYARAFQSAAPSALAITPTAGASVPRLVSQIHGELGPESGLAVDSAAKREANINALTSEGLSQLGVISTLLVLAAIAALAAALTSSIHQRRGALASLRLSGAPPARLRRILGLEAGLMLAAGCVTGAIAGFYGQYVIDAYLRHVTGFPVAGAGASARPIVVLAIVLSAALALVALPAWIASRVSPALALGEE
jgi:putative ABC transport system permease protein